jgi:hypothetical protein
MASGGRGVTDPTAVRIRPAFEHIPQVGHSRRETGSHRHWAPILDLRVTLNTNVAKTLLDQ